MVQSPSSTQWYRLTHTSQKKILENQRKLFNVTVHCTIIKPQCLPDCLYRGEAQVVYSHSAKQVLDL